MNGSYLNLELMTIRSRTRKFMVASVVIHLLFFLLVYVMRSTSPELEGLVEISWIEPIKNIPAATKIETALKEVVVKRSSVHKTQEHFVRETPEADVAPRPQIAKVSEDKFNEKLASLQRDAIKKHTQIAAIATPSITRNPTLAGIPVGESEPGQPGELTRKPTGSGKPVELRRGPVKTSKPALAGTRLPEVQVTPEPAKPIDSMARRTLAGASLSGPVADRPLVSYSTPLYPEWAKREGVEGSSTIYFVVLPDGHVKESVVVQKTSGFEDFDCNAIEALLAWRFQPLPGDQTGEQWGTITFHYRLNDATSN